MSLNRIRPIRWSCVLGVVALLLAAVVPAAWPQTSSQGTVTVLVMDPSAGIVQGAKLVLQNTATNEVHDAETQQVGSYTFVALPLGTYRLTVSKSGFQTEVLDSVVVQGGRVTDVKVSLKVGAATEKVVVSESSVPLVELTSSAISTTIDTKQIEELPLQGRDISSLAQLSPGYSGTGGFGTWNGLPVIAQGNTIDGVVSSTSRMKFAGNVQPGLEARLEDIQEMSVQSSQADLNQGMGLAAMQVNFVTRSGSNDYHGRVFEDFRNTALNANSWFNNAVGLPKTPIILNEFGGSAGGHIIKDKLFFFGSFAMAKQPGGYIAGSQVLSSLAQQGILTEANGTQVNLFTQVAQPNGLPNCVTTPSICQAFATQQALINKGVASGGVSLSDSGDSNVQNVSWLVPSPTTKYYPAFRVDYNASQKVRIDFSFEETKVNQPNASNPFFPGSDFASQAASFKSNNYIASLGVNWTIKPTLINQFRVGYYYNAFWYAFGGNPAWDTLPQINWAIGTSGETFQLPVTTYYPIVNASDNATWMRGRHTVTFGFNFFREQDHYWNPPDGIPSVSLGLVNGDPAFQPFENYFPGDTQDTVDAENLYATLIGRISGIGPVGSGFPYDQKTGQYATKPGSAYNLDELQKGWGLYAHDSFRLTPRLTINYGLRWDFTGDNHDLTAAYHGASEAEIFGPSGSGNAFKPGTLTGDLNPAYVASSHQYNGWNVTPQPTIGLAWNPTGSEGFLGRLLGGNNTVIRAGFDIKRFTEPYQYFWNSASNHGMAFFQSFSLQPAAGGGTGTFPTGGLSLPSQPTDANLATVLAPYPYSVAPPAYAASLQQSLFTWNYYFSGAGMDPNIKEPYVQQWNLGIQRQLGASNVLEIRYLGHRTLHQWIGVNTNEVNIFENGFLQEFKNAQSNLKICMATPSCASAPSFGNKGLAGQVALPIFDTAFRTESGGPGSFADYTNGSFITDLNRGAAGTLALQLAYPFGNAPYICNLVGSSLSPCSTQYGYTTPGAYPVNFFQANPYADGIGFKNFGDTAANASFLSAAGFGTYNALQVDFRQKQWHGMQFDVNYTWSHTLGVQPDGQWTGAVNIYSIRDLNQAYAPTLFDLRHVMHASGTFDLPFGHGKKFLNSTGVMDKVVGGWTLGTIFTYQTGFPFQLTGAYKTFNEYGAGGLALNGVSLSQLQGSLGVRNPNCASACGFVNDINPSLLTGLVPGSACQSRLARVCQNTTPGTFGSQVWLYGPHLWNDDLSLSKVVPFGERFKFTLQGEFLNAFNHPNFANPNANISSSSFGHSGPSNFNGPRVIELRANISF
jgi:hypothetical protein